MLFNFISVIRDPYLSNQVRQERITFLVAERIGYVDRAKEVIYEALNAAGITIAFPQCDVHLISNEEK